MDKEDFLMREKLESIHAIELVSKFPLISSNYRETLYSGGFGDQSHVVLRNFEEQTNNHTVMVKKMLKLIPLSPLYMESLIATDIHFESLSQTSEILDFQSSQLPAGKHAFSWFVRTLREPLFNLPRNFVVSPDSYSVFMPITNGDVTTSFRKGHKHLIRRTLKDNAVSFRYASSDDYSNFLRIYNESCSRNEITPRPETYIKAIFTKHLLLGECVIGCALYQSEPIAFVVYAKTNDAYYYWLGCQASEYMSLGAMHLVHYFLISAASCENRVVFLGSRNLLGSEKEQRIGSFKSGFSNAYFDFWTFQVKSKLWKQLSGLTRSIHSLKNQITS